MASWKDDLASDAILLRMTNGLRALCVQSYDEMNKKRGMQWEASRLITLVGGSTVYSTITTGAQPVDLKSRVFGYDGLGVVGRIYKSPVTPSTPTADPWFNMNTGTVGQPLAVLRAGVTVGGVGTKIGADIFAIGPASQQSRGLSPTNFASNRILQPLTTYLLEITSLDPADQQVSARLEMYEGGLDFPNTDYP